MGRSSLITVMLGVLTLSACHAPVETPPPTTPPDAAPFVAWPDAPLFSKQNGRCLVARDFDGDERPDLLVAENNGPGRRDRSGGDPVTASDLVIYRNVDGTHFERRVVGRVDGGVTACTAGDLDRDGDVDLVAGVRSTTPLMSFTQLDAAALSYEAPRPIALLDASEPTALTLFDADGDGELDLWVGYQANGRFIYENPCTVTPTDYQCHLREPLPASVAPVLLRNRKGTMAVMRPGDFKPAFMNGMQVIDWDGDGRVELFESTDFGINRFLRGGVDGYTDILNSLQDPPFNNAMGLAFADFDGNGAWDFLVSDIGPVQLWMGGATPMQDHAASAGLIDATALTISWSPRVIDLENDGDADIYLPLSAREVDRALFDLDVHSAHPAPRLSANEQADLVLTNRLREAGRFDVTLRRHPTTWPDYGHSLSVVADFDDDGREDVAVLTESWGETSTELLRNVTPSTGGWLSVRLVPTTSNPDTIGATVMLFDGEVEVGRRAVGSGDARGVAEERMHFGLGTHAAVTSIKVRWPAGAEVTYEGPFTSGQHVRLEQR